MIRLDLIRVLDNGDCTRGVLVDAARGVVLAVAIERPWANNERGISAIPPGEYNCRPSHVSPTFGEDCIAIDDVPGRKHCLIHIANRASELRGCIAVGREFGRLGDEDAVFSSTQTFNYLIRYTGQQDFTLVVHKAPQGQ